MTRQICVAALAAMAAMLWQPAQALACSCAPPPDITTQWGAMPDAVVAARVTSEFTIGSKKIYVAKVRKAFKGCAAKGDRLYIVTRTSSAACGTTLNVGGTYLLGDEAQALSEGRWLMNLSLCDLQVPWKQLSKAERAFLNGREVCCDGSCWCADGSDPVQCFVDPCQVSSCDEGACVANYCGGCNAEHYDKSGNLLCLPCTGNEDCGTGEACVDGQCQAGCSSDDDCPTDEWCRPSMDGPMECVPFQQEGDWCGGFTPIWAQNKCAPGLICTDFPPFIADAPGTCRKECNDNDDCADDQYCSLDDVCRDDGACWVDNDCSADGNVWPHILCLGWDYCAEDGQCGWECGPEPVPTCEDLSGVDFGPCLAILGIGVVGDSCTWISGCGADGVTLFDTFEECEATCFDKGCNSDGDCSEDEYCAGNGECMADGTCSDTTDCNAAGNLYPVPFCIGYGVCEAGQCGWICGEPEPTCDDIGGVDFGACEMLLGVAVVNGKCNYVSGCGAAGYAFFDSMIACEAACAPAGCEVDGKWFAPGDSIPAGDGCNMCSCMDNGFMACTKIGCLIGCTSEMSCEDNWSMCWAPGQQLPCGACFMPENTCNSDTACGPGMICTEDTSGCLCESANTCSPACSSAADCEEGESCYDDGHCKPTACTSTNDCPINFDCADGGCKRRACSASTECWGFCVNGRCYTESGYCSPPPP